MPSVVGQEQFRRALRRALAAPLVLAAALAGVYLWQIGRLLERERSVNHSDRVLAQAHETEKLLLRMQNSVRGYLLSGQPHFLDKYRQADAAVPVAAGKLARLVADDPAQGERAAAVASIVGRSREVSSALVAMRDRGEDYQTYVGNEPYRLLLDERDRVFSDFLRVEADRRAWRSAAAQRTAKAVVAASLVVTALVGLALAAVVRRQLRTLSASYRRAMEAERRGKEELERQVDERTAQLRDAVSQLEAFGYTISHDLRAPLRAMQGFSQALVEDYAEQLDPTARQYVGRIAAAAERMDEMILDLLAYSRVSRSELSLGPVDLGAVIAEAMGRVAAEVNHRGAAVGLDGPFPPVLGHAATLVQVVANLLTNAVKFVPPGVRPEVSVYAREADGRVRLWVRDRGIGIAPEHREKIFNVFERLHGTEEFPGSGIGLAIVRRAVERMGGACGVESEPGRGSQFWVELPQAPKAR